MSIVPDVKVFPPGPESLRILNKAKKVIARTSYSGLFGISLEGGEDNCVIDFDNNVYLDCLGAASANTLGYSFNSIADAYFKTAIRMQHTGYLYSPNENAVKLAEQLIEISPIKGSQKVVLGSNGSDANGCAIEISRKYTGNMGIIHFNNDYHGSTGLSQQASNFGTLNKDIFPDSSLFIGIEYPVTSEQSRKSLDSIENYLKTRKAGGVIMEVIQGDAGVIFPYKGFIDKLSKIVRKFKALLIFDEVQSGMGRTGKWWACERLNIEPDLLVTGKGLSAGYAPISAVIGRTEIMEFLAPGQQIFTYAGHSPSAAAACEVISTIKKENLVSNAAEKGVLLKKGLEKIQRKFQEIILEVRGHGLMIGVEINIHADNLAGIIFATRCVEKGVYVGYFGVNKEVVRIEPPITLLKKEVEFILHVINEVALEMENGSIPEQTIINVKKYAVGL